MEGWHKSQPPDMSCLELDHLNIHLFHTQTVVNVDLHFVGKILYRSSIKIGCLTPVARVWWPLSALGHKVSILWKGHNNVAPLTETWLLKPWLCTKCWQLLIAYLSQYNIPLWICEGVLPWWTSKIDCCLRMGSTWSRVARGGVWKRGSCAPRPASVDLALGMSSNH